MKKLIALISIVLLPAACTVNNYTTPTAGGETAGTTRAARTSARSRSTQIVTDSRTEVTNNLIDLKEVKEPAAKDLSVGGKRDRQSWESRKPGLNGVPGAADGVDAAQEAKNAAAEKVAAEKAAADAKVAEAKAAAEAAKAAAESAKTDAEAKGKKFESDAKKKGADKKAEGEKARSKVRSGLKDAAAGAEDAAAAVAATVEE